MGRFSVIIEGTQTEKTTGIRVNFTGEKTYALPLDYEKTEEIIAYVLKFMKNEDVRSKCVTFGKESESQTYSIARVYDTGIPTWSTVYWPRKNETLPYDKIEKSKKVIKEIVLYSLKFERDW